LGIIEILKGKIMKANKFLKTFFEEKNLVNASWEVDGKSGMPNHFTTEVLIEQILTAPAHEQKGIEAVIRKIDFYNGNVLDYLKHLSKAIAI
jgi:hypothetical protein